MDNQNLYQPTAEELEALWEKGSKRDMPCPSSGCVPCMQLHGRRLAALTQILEHAQQYQFDRCYEEVRLTKVSCIFCHKQVPINEAHLHQGNWVGPCCWDERLRTTE